jgi:uncharacterized protein
VDDRDPDSRDERFEDDPLEVLDESTCWELLRTVDVGRLAFPTPDGGVEIFPLNHVIDQGSIVFRTAVGTKLSGATAAAEVAFEADNSVEHGGVAWSVVLHGRAELITHPTELFDSFELDVRPWHASRKPYFVRVSPTSVSGRRFAVDRTARHRPPTAP